MVSIVVVNRDGAGLLRRLLAGLVERTDYPSLELVLVDNASSDDSLALARGVETPFPVSILANSHNESFADACNQGAELAAGELLLFLNNDVEPFEPAWLRELVACLEGAGTGAVGPTYLEPYPGAGESSGFAVQQRGLTPYSEDGTPVPGFRERGAGPFGEALGADARPVAISAACLLIARKTFEEVGGFTHGFLFGGEDIDLCLKLRSAGRGVLCSGRSLLLHQPGSTLARIPAERQRAWQRGNRRLFLERWGPQLHREYELDRLEGGGLWVEAPTYAEGDPRPTRAEIEALGFCLFAEDGDLASLEDLCCDLRRLGRRCLALAPNDARDLRALDYDVAIYIGGAARLVPARAQLNVLWQTGDQAPPGEAGRSRYDLVLADPPPLAPSAESLLAAVEPRVAEVGYRRRIDRD